VSWRAPDFWNAPRPEWRARLLQPLAELYGAAAAWRMARRGARAAIPVVCVGNFTAGGAGKTPTVLALLPLLRAFGFAPAVVSRGYGGRLAGPLRVDPAIHTAAEVGDEPLLIAAHAPAYVARERAAGVVLAAREGATLALLDDGLQNPALAKTLSFAVVDGAVGVGNGLCLPAGPLRAPLAAQWPKVDALVVIGEGPAGEALAATARALGKAALAARLMPDPAVAASLAGQRVLALAGIGRPEKFAATLRETGAEVIATAYFADHHPFSAAEVAAVAERAKAAGARVVTTAKDAMRLAPLWREAEHGPLAVLPVSLAVADDAALRNLLAEKLGRGDG
jgi:tetraacyldisaccharide 4'-kinase